MVAGNWMAMECRPDNDWQVIMWDMEQPVTGSYETIFRNHDRMLGLTGQYSSRFGVDMDESCSGLLYTNETLLEDAGLYICRIERSADRDEFSAQLIVFGKNKGI